jgi:capsular polysaccharide biosynthesis protein
MELRQYWNVVWKRKWLVLAIIAVAAALSAFLFLRTGRVYQEQIRFITRQQQQPSNNQPGIFDYNLYYNWISSEYMVDDFTEIVKSDSFNMAVIDTLKSEIDSGQITEVQTGTLLLDWDKLRTDVAKLKLSDINGYISTDRKQRELRVIVNGPTRDMTAAVLDAAGIVLTGNKIVPIRGQYGDKPVLGQIDKVTLDKIDSSLSKDVINAAIRVALGIVAALVLVFLLEYLDNSVRDERDAKRVLELPVLGAIPKI